MKILLELAFAVCTLSFFVLNQGGHFCFLWSKLFVWKKWEWHAVSCAESYECFSQINGWRRNQKYRWISEWIWTRWKSKGKEVGLNARLQEGEPEFVSWFSASFFSAHLISLFFSFVSLHVLRFEPLGNNSKIICKLLIALETRIERCFLGKNDSEALFRFNRATAVKLATYAVS